jgi:hypothetical protein
VKVDNAIALLYAERHGTPMKSSTYLVTPLNLDAPREKPLLVRLIHDTTSSFDILISLSTSLA